MKSADGPRRGAVIWMTGLSGAGKSTLAEALRTRLNAQGAPVVVLDGDALRRGLNTDLGFSEEDRTENVRRIAHVAALFAANGAIAIGAVISPLASQRAMARAIVDGRFVEVFVDTPLDVCEARDPKGLYARARSGDLPDFTGVTGPFEAPAEPDIHLAAHGVPVETSLDQLVDELVASGIVGKGAAKRARH